jgi:hypothetical protein
MPHIKIIAFKGCLPALELHDRLGEILRCDPTRFTLCLDIVPTPQQAEARKLFGSPTILVDDREYQTERRGPAGFY